MPLLLGAAAPVAMAADGAEAPRVAQQMAPQMVQQAGPRPAPRITGKIFEPGYEVPAHYCRDGEGNRRELGEVICVTASCQTWMARCEQSLNNTIWRKVSEGCPAAALEAPSPTARLKALATAKRTAPPV